MRSRKPGQACAPRRIHLLSQAANIAINPGEWIGVSSGKVFDEKSTAILRVTRHRDGVRWLVYGMRSQLAEGAKVAAVAAEMYEMVPVVELLGVAIDKVAMVCGVEPLVADVKKALP